MLEVVGRMFPTNVKYLMAECSPGRTIEISVTAILQYGYKSAVVAEVYIKVNTYHCLWVSNQNPWSITDHRPGIIRERKAPHKLMVHVVKF